MNTAPHESTDPRSLEELIASSRTNMEARNELMKRLQAYLWRLGRTRLYRQWRAVTSAESIVQETNLKIHEHLDSFDGNTAGELHAWVMKILVRQLAKVAEHYGAQKRDPRRVQEGDDWHKRLVSQLSSPSAKIEEAETKAVLWQAILILEPRRREALILHHFGGLTYEEVGDLLGVSDERARQLYHLALKDLSKQEHLRDYFKGR